MNTPSTPRARASGLGLPAEAVSSRLRQAAAAAIAAERYDLSVLRLGSVAPPTLPRSAHQVTARDGDLARTDAQVRYQLLARTRQQQLAAARPTAWQNLMAGRTPAGPPSAYTVAPATNTAAHPNTPEAARRRVQAHELARLRAQNVADHALEHQVGEGVLIGGMVATSTVVSEVALLRLASGLRWAGAARTATVLQGMTYTGAARLGTAARNLSWTGAEDGLLGLRAGLKGLKKAPGQALVRSTFDVVGQGGAGYISSENHGWARFKDAGLGINVVETGLAAYGVKPFGISVGSAAFQYTKGKGYQSVFNGGVSSRAFLAQAAIGTAMGHLGEYGTHVLDRRLAYELYQGAILRLGPDVAYPVWLGSSQLFKKAVPAGFGVTEEYYEGLAQDQWPASATKP